MRPYISCAILAIIFTGCAGPTIEPLSVGGAVPAFALDVVGSQREMIDNDSLRGEVVLLNFWSTNCANCLLEIEELKAIHSEGRVRVVGIAIDDDTESVAKLIESKQVNYPVLNGNEETFLRFDGFSTPYSLILDSELKVRKKITGRMDKKEFDALVETI